MKTALVATHGGHVGELHALRDQMTEVDSLVWITNDHPQTRLLIGDEPVKFVPFIDSRDVRGILRALPEAWRMCRTGSLGRMVSTGSAIALAYLPVAALFRIPAHYIESITRVHEPSLTGRLLHRLPGISTWWQHESAPAGWRPLPGLLSQYKSAPASVVAPVKKVSVSVGTTDYCFRRLIKQLVAEIPADVEVFWQTGASDTSGLGIHTHKIVDSARLQQEIQDADVVVTHAGAGSLLQTLAVGKAPVLVPRREKYGEQIDDHQSELADLAKAQDLAVVADATELRWDHLVAAAAKEIRFIPNLPIDLKAK